MLFVGPFIVTVAPSAIDESSPTIVNSPVASAVAALLILKTGMHSIPKGDKHEGFN